ncbi:MAG: hypothetical protein V7629_12695 [Motiliproteus sp.]
MKDFLMKLWTDEEGAETAEWVVIVALLVVVAFAVYDGVLKTQLNLLITSIGTKIQTAITP